jgi:hypothetical protein
LELDHRLVYVVGFRDKRDTRGYKVSARFHRGGVLHQFVQRLAQFDYDVLEFVHPFKFAEDGLDLLSDRNLHVVKG